LRTWKIASTSWSDERAGGRRGENDESEMAVHPTVGVGVVIVLIGTIDDEDVAIVPIRNIAAIVRGLGITAAAAGNRKTMMMTAAAVIVVAEVAVAVPAKAAAGAAAEVVVPLNVDGKVNYFIFVSLGYN
jgi:hypothetical protein